MDDPGPGAAIGAIAYNGSASQPEYQDRHDHGAQCTCADCRKLRLRAVAAELGIEILEAQR